MSRDHKKNPRFGDIFRWPGNNTYVMFLRLAVPGDKWYRNATYGTWIGISFSHSIITPSPWLPLNVTHPCSWEPAS